MRKELIDKSSTKFDQFANYKGKAQAPGSQAQKQK
jgi:hypothetical protein